MDGKEQIIELGRILALEARSGFEDRAVEGGLVAFLQRWQQAAGGALRVPAVQRAIASLADYTELDSDEREARLTVALEGLRDLFRTPKPTAPEKPAPSGRLRMASQKGDSSTSGAEGRARQTPLGLDDPIGKVPGIGSATARAFHRLGVHTVRDLLYHFPHRYDDFSKRKNIADLLLNEVETVVAEVRGVRIFKTKSGREAVEVLVGDETGQLKAVWFGSRWLANQFEEGRRIVLSGKVTSFNGQRQMTGPQWELYTEDELIHTGRLVPVHPLTKGLQDRNARRIIKQVVDMMASRVPDPLPEKVRQQAGLMPLSEALTQIHFPDDWARLTRARQRLGFDEFLSIQLGVLRRRKLWQGARGLPLAFQREIHEEFLRRLPFALTGAQERALEEIFADLARPVPMARLLQGDVGSGKTVVAAAAMVQAVANGFQAAMMAPTEILAEQHYKGLKSLLRQVHIERSQPDSEDWRARQDRERLERLAEIQRILGMTDEDDAGGTGIRVALLTGSLKSRERDQVLKSIAEGEIDVVIGTHALIQESVEFRSLGLAVVDEQHRFGVEQRELLKRKGFNPHLLVMTATPIPRSLALTIYGDLDVSVLDERPPGRRPIKTKWITSAEREKAYKHLRKEIAAGRQAFVICPLVEESEKVELAAATEEYERLQQEVFPDLRVGLIHGRMSAREKDAVMTAFRNHEFDILVATAVVEVGIDVPNATTIVIEGAERFGLAQLHQFRGRVGRGVHQSYCILISDKEDNEVTKTRLSAMEQTEDGFRLAEIDLELRGPGEFFGRRQSGTPDLKVARLADTRLLHAARQAAERILREDPELSLPEHALLREHTEAFWSTVEPEAS